MVTSPVEGVELSLSGKLVGQTPLQKPLLSRSGTPMLMATAKGYEPFFRELTVPAGGTLAVTLDLVPTTVTPGSAVILTSTPDTNVLVDGQLVGVTPDVTKVPVMPGARTFSVAREHSSSAELVVNISEGGVVDVPLEPTATPGEETAQVAVTSTGERHLHRRWPSGRSPGGEDDRATRARPPSPGLRAWRLLPHSS